MTPKAAEIIRSINSSAPSIPVALQLPYVLSRALFMNAVEDSYDPDQEIAREGREYLESDGKALCQLIGFSGGPHVRFDEWLEGMRETWKAHDAQASRYAETLAECRLILVDIETLVNRGVFQWATVCAVSRVSYASIWYYRVGHAPDNPTNLAKRLRLIRAIAESKEVFT